MKNVKIDNNTYNNVPSIDVPLATGSGNASFYDVSDTTAQASDVLNTKYFYTANGVRTQGTNSGGSTINNQNKTVTPDETQKDVTYDSGYTGLGTVTVEAISSTYVGTGITRRSSSDLSDSGATVTVPSGYYASQGTKSVTSGTAGTPTATKGTVSNHSVSVTPSVTNTTGYITGSTKTGTAVTVTASELVSGSETKTANGTYDVTNLAELVVNVSGGGGASNFVTGTFTTGSSAGVGSVTISYSGSGYPLMCYVVIENGAYNNTSTGNTTWYNSVQRYAIGVWAMSKSVFTSTPTYSTSGSANQAVTMAIYKNSTSTATTYTRTSAMNTNTFSSSNASNAAATAIRFKANKTLSYYVNTSSYGLLPSTTYRYYIVYSS